MAGFHCTRTSAALERWVRCATTVMSLDAMALADDKTVRRPNHAFTPTLPQRSSKHANAGSSFTRRTTAMRSVRAARACDGLCTLRTADPPAARCHCGLVYPTTTSKRMDLIDRLRLDVPVLQAGMGGGVSGPRLAGAVAAAGGLGTLALTSPRRLRAGIASVREQAPGRAIAVNLLMPFVRKRHIAACVAERIDVAILFFGGSAALVAELHAVGTFVMAQVGTVQEAAVVLAWGVDGLIAQGIEAGGHLLGREPGLAFLARVLPLAGARPVLLAGGMVDASDTRAALAAGAAGIVAGTRFMLTPEADAHPLYQQRVLAANATLETTLFGFGWAARHRVVANAATARWCRGDGSVRSVPAFLNRMSAPLSHVINDALITRLPGLQRAWLPMLAAAPPLLGMSAATVDSAPLYAGESALRMSTIISAKAAVDTLAGRTG